MIGPQHPGATVPKNKTEDEETERARLALAGPFARREADRVEAYYQPCYLCLRLNARERRANPKISKSHGSEHH